MMPLSMRPPKEFRFDNPRGRPFRAISIEVEVDGQGAQLAQGLCRSGVVANPGVSPYGWHPGPNHPQIAFCKKDGTVTAGEVVFDRINLTDPLHAKATYKGLVALRKLEKDGNISFNPNCGGHIHVDADGYGFYDVLRLTNLYGHLEEVICRVAGAGHTYGHRTLYRGYDRNGGRVFAAPVVKGPWPMDIAETYRRLRAQNRMVGLNLTLYYANTCMGCKGKRYIDDKESFDKAGFNQWKRDYRRAYGEEPSAPKVERYMQKYHQKSPIDMKTCVCNKEKFTIEWRVWNSQGNPRILYAWIALMQAMHAYAWVPADHKNYKKSDDLEAFDWTQRPYKQLTEATKQKAQSRVDWMFSELPMTDEEKDALAYAMMRTPYKEWGKEFFKTRANYGYKPPPHENTYKGIPLRKVADVGVVDHNRPLVEANDAAPMVDFVNANVQDYTWQAATRRVADRIRFENDADIDIQFEPEDIPFEDDEEVDHLARIPRLQPRVVGGRVINNNPGMTPEQIRAHPGWSAVECNCNDCLNARVGH